MSRSLIAAALLLALGACASADDRAAAQAAAHTCQQQFPNPNQVAEYNSCVNTVENDIREARAYHAEPDHPAHRPSRGGRGGGGGGSH